MDDFDFAGNPKNRAIVNILKPRVVETLSLALNILNGESNKSRSTTIARVRLCG